MATRLYLDLDVPAPITPAVNGTWTATANNDYRMFVRHKINRDNRALKTITGLTGGTNLFRTYISERLAAQTISGTVKAQILVYESATQANAFSRMELYVVTEDGASVVGTLLSGPTNYGTLTEWNSGSLLNNRFLDGDTVTNVSCSAGDRIVWKVGCQADSRNGNMQFGNFGGAVADLGENVTDTAGTAWLEFNTNLTFLTPAVADDNGLNLYGFGDIAWAEGRLKSRRMIF